MLNRRIVNKKSKKEYEKNEKNHKYISDLYVELGNCNEKLRYMYNSKKWKKRVKKEFHMVLKTNVGKMLKKQCNIKFYQHLTLNGLNTSLKKCYEFLENCRNNFDYNDDNRNLMFYLYHNSYYIRDYIYTLYEYSQMMSNNVCFLLGKAGSGKTNLLTYFAKYLISVKSECIYIDSKDVTNNDIESKFFSYFHSNLILKENKNILISILLLLKRITKSKIVVIVEAINENSNSEFYKNLVEFINKYSKCKNIKIVISSRTEFYNLKFKDIFDEYLDKNVKSIVITIENSNITENIYEKMYLKYKKYFNFTGTTTSSVRRTLYDSPIFMRIFFENYSNSSANVTDINKSKIFSEYIAKLSKDYPSLNSILNEIIEKMINSKKFDYVYIENLKSSIIDIKNLIFEHVLLTHSIIENDGLINESKKEILMITYDEIRDYLITNSLISKYKKNELDVKTFIDEMIKQKYSILDGVIKNLYIYFKDDDPKICKYILGKRLFVNYNYGNRDVYKNAHLELIFSTRKELSKFEEDYLSKLEYIYPEDLAKMILNCTYNLIYNISPGVQFITKKMQNFMDKNDRVYDFSRIYPNFYRNIIIELKKYNNENIEKYTEILIKLLHYLEENYDYEEDD